MALFNIFKKKKTKKFEKPVVSPPSVPAKQKRVFPTAYRILKQPHVTEKASALTEENQYVFEVAQDANKVEVKKAVEALYGVDVEQVRMINIPRKIRIFRGKKGWKQGYKKAIVKLKQGQKIERLPK